MANPYIMQGGALQLAPGAPLAPVLTGLKPPTPPIRQLPLPAVLIPTMSTGG